MSEKIKIVIVDDSSFMRNILGRLVEKDGRFEVIGKAKNGSEGVEMVKSLKPDVVTMDIEMPVMTGIEALKIIMKECPTPVVMVSSLTREGANSTLEAMDYGAVDFIPKSMESSTDSVLTNSKVLMDKIHGAAKARMVKPMVKPMTKPKLADRVVAEKPKAAVKPSILKMRLPNVKVMVIGSSTGGPRALQDFIPLLPSDLKVPVVIAQHMPEHFTGPMAERLDSISKIKVVEAKDGDILRAGTIYISPGGVHTRIKGSGMSLSLSVKEDSGKECVYRPSVDILAASTAEHVGGSALALMLTGMGTDGAKGFEELKNKGGYILSQDKESSVVYGMPKAVAAISDEVLPLNDVVSAIIRLIGNK